MREPPQPGDQIILLYREGETEYGMIAVCARVVPVPHTDVVGGRSDLALVWFRAGGGKLLCRWLDEEGIEWARAPVRADNDALRDVVTELSAARRLAGTGA